MKSKEAKTKKLQKKNSKDISKSRQDDGDSAWHPGLLPSPTIFYIKSQKPQNDRPQAETNIPAGGNGTQLHIHPHHLSEEMKIYRIAHLTIISLL